MEVIERHIDEVRRLRVAVIGGGLSGITAGVLLPAKVPGIELVIYEKNADLGGTWYENRYPGVRCDIPSHTYQATFAPKHDWTDRFAYGSEICAYWQGVARRFGVYELARLRHRVEHAEWDDDITQWRLRVEFENDVREERFDVVMTAIGRFNAWRLPNYPGVDQFQGIVRHASDFDTTFDPKGKRVAVVGNGASGIQLVANLQPQVAELHHYIRNPTWIASSWAGDVRLSEPQPYSDDEIASLGDATTYRDFRKRQDDKYFRTFRSVLRGTAEHEELKARTLASMRERLQGRPDLLALLIPEFEPNCRRLTPGPGYLEALTQDNASVKRTAIRRFIRTGVVLEDGSAQALDAVFCATGFNADMAPPFPIVARGLNLGEAWKEGGKWGYPHTYLGHATPGFPNFFFVLGPQGGAAGGVTTLAVESQLTHYAKILRKLSREGIRTIEPTEAAADDFVAYSHALFSRTALSGDCSSWYNGGMPGGYIHGLFPGSGLHASLARREPRWEDYSCSYLSENRFAWFFGDGVTAKELDPDADVTKHVKLPEEIDLRSLHEEWWE